MKKITKLNMLFATITLFLFSVNAIAQTDYTYTLVDNGSFSYSVVAVPTTTTSTFPTAVIAYGVTIFVPDGVGLAITNSLGGSAGSVSFGGDQVGGSATEDGYQVTENLSGLVNIAAPNVTPNTALVTMQLSNITAAGTVRIMPNDGPESNAFGGLLVSFLTADTVDDGVSATTNAIINSTTGLSGTSSFMFDTLSVDETTLTGISVYPIPTKDVLNIKGLQTTLEIVEVFNMAGQLVKTFTSNLEAINVGDLPSGIYFAKLKADTVSTTLRFMKE